MKKHLSFFIGSLLVSCSTTTNFDPQTVSEQITAEETKTILFTLADDKMKGRDSKSGGYYDAAEFAVNYFKEHNVNAFYPKYRDSLLTDGLLSYNIVGQIGDFDSTRKTVMIGAHLDHVGIRGSTGDTIYNGANDNATGSTAVLQISRFLAQYKWDKNILVALFADEERGLKGAEHLAKRLEEENINLSYMVNFEMIGKTLTTGENQVYMTGYERSNMADVMNSFSPNFVQFLPEAKDFNLFRRSDNYPIFKTLDIPAQTLSSFDFKNYDFYHKAEDEAEKMDIENMNRIIGTSAYTIAKMLQSEMEIKMNPIEE